MPDALNAHSLDDLIRWGGYALLFFIIFSETGLFFGFLLPGDALILTAGLVAAGGALDIFQVNLVMICAAILGDSTGYVIGKKLGRKFFEKQDSLFFRQEYLQRTKSFYETHGGKTIFFARYIPVVRSFATTVAGITEMPYLRFLLFSITGAATWILSLTLLGYFVGKQFPELETYINAVVIIVICGIILSILINFFKSRSSKLLS